MQKFLATKVRVFLAAGISVSLLSCFRMSSTAWGWVYLESRPHFFRAHEQRYLSSWYSDFGSNRFGYKFGVV